MGAHGTTFSTSFGRDADQRPRRVDDSCNLGKPAHRRGLFACNRARFNRRLLRHALVSSVSGCSDENVVCVGTDSWIVRRWRLLMCSLFANTVGGPRVLDWNTKPIERQRGRFYLRRIRPDGNYEYKEIKDGAVFASAEFPATVAGREPS